MMDQLFALKTHAFFFNEQSNHIRAFNILENQGHRKFNFSVSLLSEALQH